jgi:outer membrane protein assembly factor BamB
MRALILAAILLAGIAQVRAEHWPHWRGPASTGVSSEKGLPERWSDTENVAWKAPVRGLGISSPIVWGDHVFVTSQIGRSVRRAGNHPTLVQGGNPAESGERGLGSTAATGDKVSFLVTALNRNDGRKLWEYEVPAEGQLAEVHDKHNLASSSPVTDGRRVYAWFGSGQLVALDFSGRPVWSRHLGREYAPFDINWGHSSSPVLFNDSLILVCYHLPTAYLLNLDAASGKTRWRVERGRDIHSYSTPLVVPTSGGVPEIVVNSSEGVSGHDATTGQLLWHIQEQNRFPIPMPVFHDGLIYTSRGYRSGPYMAIRPGGKGDVSRSHVPWRIDTGAPYVSSLVHYNGLLYMAGDVGVLSAIDAKTGQRVWQERTGGVFTASPVAGDGKIYLLSEDGQTIVLAAGNPPRVLARNRLNARQLASPAISGGRLFIRTDDAVIAVGNRALVVARR